MMTTAFSISNLTSTAVPDRPMLIGGSWVESETAEWSDVPNPGRGGVVLGRVPRGSVG